MKDYTNLISIICMAAVFSAIQIFRIGMILDRIQRDLKGKNHGEGNR